MTKTGKLIVLYGINNLGKSTQAKLLLNNLLEHGYRAEYLKYPIYDLLPTGPQINDILRGGRKQTISEIELQQLYAQNRRDYQPTLKEKLDHGIHIISEDYTGTGLAWGVTKGAPLVVLEKLNADLLTEDLAVLLDGQRFIEGKESIHLHEEDDELMNRCRQAHLDLAKKYGWQLVNANDSVTKVQEDIWQNVISIIEKK